MSGAINVTSDSIFYKLPIPLIIILNKVIPILKHYEHFFLKMYWAAIKATKQTMKGNVIQWCQVSDVYNSII